MATKIITQSQFAQMTSNMDNRQIQQMEELLSRQGYVVPNMSIGNIKKWEVRMPFTKKSK